MADQLIGFCGWAQSGKDTAALCLAKKGFTRMAFADPLRDLLHKINPMIQDYQGLGWVEYIQALDWMGYEQARAMYPEIRVYLQRLGQALRDDDPYYWVKKSFDKLPEGPIAFSDVRYIEEWYAITGAGGQVYRIVRPGCGPANVFEEQKHSLSEVEIPVIMNDGSLGEFYEKICALVE